MKTIYKIFSIILAGMFSVVSCDDDLEREPSPEVAQNCQGVFFPPTNASTVELEPTDPTEMTIRISRTAKDAATIPLTAEINEGGVFVFPESISFASGDTVQDFKVTFPEAKEGVSYILKLKVEGHAYVNSYASTNPYVQTSVTRIKWENVDPGVMQEGIVATFYGVAYSPFYVQMQKATLGNGVLYRLINPFRAPSKFDEEGDAIPDQDGIFDGYPFNEPGDVVDGEYLMVITVYESGSVSVAPSDMGMDWGYGMFSTGSIYGNLSQNITSYPLGTIEGDVISFPANSLYCSMTDYQNGGKYPAKATTLYLSKEAYLEANSNIDDFNKVEYKKESGAVSAFESAAFENEWDQELWKAIDQKPDDEDSPYKNLYYLPNLYSKGFGLAFYFNGEKITIPKNQPTGVKFLDNDIYVSPSVELTSGVETISSTGLKTYSFGLNFHTKDETSLGDFTETFFYSKNEIKRSIDDFCGLFTLKATSAKNNSALEYTVKIEKKDSKTLKISGLLDPASADGFKYSKDAVTATFKSSESCAILEPQELGEKLVYQGAEFPVFFLTYSSADGDLFDDQAIQIICRYNNVLKFTSTKDNTAQIDGFGYYAVGAGSFDNIPHKITLTPTLKEQKSVKATETASLHYLPIHKGAHKSPVLLSEPETKTLSFDNLSLQQKSKNKKRMIITNNMPIF